MTVTLHGKRFKFKRPLWFSCDEIILFSCNYQNMQGFVSLEQYPRLPIADSVKTHVLYH
jgi:hypothetical protein